MSSTSLIVMAILGQGVGALANVEGPPSKGLSWGFFAMTHFEGEP